MLGYFGSGGSLLLANAGRPKRSGHLPGSVGQDGSSFRRDHHQGEEKQFESSNHGSLIQNRNAPATDEVAC
jgi:hypothetical protein